MSFDTIFHQNAIILWHSKTNLLQFMWDTHVYHIQHCWIRGSFRGRKLLRIGSKWGFHRENFPVTLYQSYRWVWHTQNFVEKILSGRPSTAKFCESFSVVSILEWFQRATHAGLLHSNPYFTKGSFHSWNTATYTPARHHRDNHLLIL